MSFMHLSMLSLWGGGGIGVLPGHMWGILITFAISTLGNLTESLGPRLGTFDFFWRGGLGPNSVLFAGSHFET